MTKPPARPIRQLMALREFPAGVRLATKSPGWKPGIIKDTIKKVKQP